MNRAVTYVAVYKPHPGKEAELLELVKRHVPALRREGLATDHPVLLLKASDGSILEIASWQSEDSARSAHANPQVMVLWNAFAACCDFQPLKNLAEAQKEFAHFERLEGVVK
jgi:quinol monooxygenase YgiN